MMAADHRENLRRRKGPSWWFRVQDGGWGGFFGVDGVLVGGLGSKLEVWEAFLGFVLGLVGHKWGFGRPRGHREGV